MGPDFFSLKELSNPSVLAGDMASSLHVLLPPFSACLWRMPSKCLLVPILTFWWSEFFHSPKLWELCKYTKPHPCLHNRILVAHARREQVECHKHLPPRISNFWQLCQKTILHLVHSRTQWEAFKIMDFLALAQAFSLVHPKKWPLALTLFYFINGSNLCSLFLSTGGLRTVLFRS